MTTNTITHDSATCTFGPDGGKCEMCEWAVECHCERYGRSFVEQSAAAIRTRRTALLERADAESSIEGAIALAEAWLSDEAWYRHLPNNTMQDAAVLELAGEIEGTVGNWLKEKAED